ncbi:hypothetical protein F991_03269 [Acinetobacter sp. CIP-A165]|uniref:hypothetical protein n=1 Tax=Acinetobacter sp. CIP-A165 TaxID=40373 RepID=UPI0002D02776|nr:hypothetical protein [Acinetobacter sp. CIP-A165]ENU29137.1 hypothetical protein F991_03269 [Acinetobacter sp. CIP-A165]
MLQINQGELYKIIYSSNHYKNWQTIARASKQCETEDVAQEAFLFVIEKWNGEFDLSNSDHWNELTHKMWNYFVHSADRTLKYALSFDQTARNDPDEAINPILLGISSSPSTGPLQRMIDDEDRQKLQKKQEKQIQENSFSMALAYVKLFESLKPKLIKYTYLNIALHMKMSYSWLRQCLKRAEKFQKTQGSLFDNLEDAPLAQYLGSWRKFKLDGKNNLNLHQY